MRHAVCFVLGSVASAWGCGAAPCPGTAEDVQAAPDPGLPAGFVPVVVVGVLPAPQGNALLLRSDAEQRVLPIFIGDAEAQVIQLRLAGETFERPLTHDLLDRILARLGGRVVRVLVTKIRGDVFLGTVVIARGERFDSIDARPSDAVAMAVGAGAPVYVSVRVLENAGLPLEGFLP